MNRQMKMRCQQKSHLLPPVALLQLLLTALLVFAAGGGSYNLSVTDTKTGDILPIMATTNSSGGRTYITNYVVIKVPQGVTFTVTPTDTSYTNKSWDFHDAGTPNHINGTNETVMVHFASTNTPITNTPVTIVSSRVDDTGRTCKTTQTVIHLLPERFRLINGDTNTADIDGKDFNHDRPTTISETSNYVTPALVSAATGHSPPIGGGNDGLDVIGVDVPLGQGRPDHQGQCDTISLMMLAKVSPTNSAPVTYGWNRTYYIRGVTISQTTTNTWDVTGHDYSTGPNEDLFTNLWYTTVPSTNNNVLACYDNPAMNLGDYSNNAPKIGDYAYQKFDFTYYLTNSIGSSYAMTTQHIGYVTIAKRINTNNVVATDWTNVVNLASTTNIPDCSGVTLSEIQGIVGSGKQIIIEPSASSNYP